MWETTDYKGNTVKWYEESLINKIKAECEDELTRKFDVTDVTQRILDLIQENEKWLNGFFLYLLYG